MNNLIFGFEDIDNDIKLDNTDLILIGGRPAMGKTSFVLNLMLRNENSKGLFISLCETEYKIRSRIKKINTVSKILPFLEVFGISQLKDDSNNLDIANFEFPRLLSIIELIADKKDQYDYFIIDDITQIEERINPLFNENKNYQYVFRLLKSVSKAIGKNIIILSNIDRIVEEENNGIGKFNFGYYGHREKILDYIVVLHRPEYYNIEENMYGEKYDEGETLVCFAKNKKRYPRPEYSILFNRDFLYFS